MIKHTPPPWEIETSGSRLDMVCINKLHPPPKNGGGEAMVETIAEVIPAVNALEDAAHIVKCVNHHDELVEALSNTSAAMESCITHAQSNRPMTKADIRGREKALNEAKALLTKLKG